MTGFGQHLLRADCLDARHASPCNPSGPFPHQEGRERPGTDRPPETAPDCRRFGMSRRTEADTGSSLARVFPSLPVSNSTGFRSQVGGSV